MSRAKELSKRLTELANMEANELADTMNAAAEELLRLSAAPAAQPMTKEQAAEVAKQLGWDEMPERFPQIVQAVERHHDIKEDASAAPAAQPTLDAKRWALLRKHWKNAQIRHHKTGDNAVKSVTITVDFTQQATQADYIEQAFDSVLSGIKEQP